MNVCYIFAYITGGIIIALSLLNFLFPKRKITLFIKTALDCATILMNVLILLATGNNLIIVSIVTNVISTIRDVIFFHRNKYKIFNNIAWPISFAILHAVSLIFTYKSPISIIPVVGSVISTLTLYANDQRITKIGAIVASSCYLTYYAILIPSSNVLTIFSLISAATSIVGTSIGLAILLKINKRNC